MKKRIRKSSIDWENDFIFDEEGFGRFEPSAVATNIVLDLWSENKIADRTYHLILRAINAGMFDQCGNVAETVRLFFRQSSPKHKKRDIPRFIRRYRWMQNMRVR